MSLLNNSNAISTGGDYNLENSLRFRASASAYLSRTQSAGTSDKIGTISLWVKGDFSSSKALFSGHTDSNNRIALYLTPTLSIYGAIGGTQSVYLISTQVLRDPSAWYHIVISWDTTQATASDRFKVYINSEQVTAWTTESYPALNADVYWNKGTSLLLGARFTTAVATHLDGYLTEVNFVDGQALTASDFGETNEDTGVWQPKKYTGTYGTNGFYLKGRGTDNSGNGNNWTENNFNTTNSALTTYDIMTDVPTLTDEDTANYAVLNPLSAGTNANISQGNLYAVGNAVNHVGVYPTILPKTGKWYFEFDIVTANSGGFGFSNSPGPISGFPGLASGYWYIYGALTTGYSIHNELTYTSYTDTRFNTGNLGQMAIDFDTGKVWVGSNNVWINSTNGTTGNPSTGANPTWTMPTGVQYYPFMEFANPATTFAMNFGQRPFKYTPPTGYLKLNTFNLPDSSIVDGSEYFVTAVYTGTGSSRSIDNTITDGSNPQVETGDPIQFQPDFTWIKQRSSTEWHILSDAIRGTDKQVFSNSTNAEQTNSTFLTSYNTDGFTVGTSTGTNGSGSTYVAWNWKAGGTAVLNEAGTIDSQVSANPTAGFSVVTFNSGASGLQSVGHGLGVAPKMVIVKDRDNVLGWNVYHSSISTDTSKFLQLNSTSATITLADIWGAALPTATLVGFKTGTNVFANADCVAYCFADVEGYSKFGSYTGNGSADGPFVYTGFRPAYVMMKCSSDAGGWYPLDATRDIDNPTVLYLAANSSNAEGDSSASGYSVDFLSNGFKQKGSGTEFNGSGRTFIYMAFAENPFKNSLAR